MNAAIFSGNLGSGKTLGMSILALYYSSKSGCTVYSNYGLNYAKPFNHYEDFIDIAKQKHSILCLDESHVDLDSRSSNTNTVKHLTQILFYLRKLRCTMFFTTPSIDNLDLRVRSIMNIYCEVSKDKNYFYYDMFDLQSEKFLRQMKIKQDPAIQLAEKIYETGAMVTPADFPSDRMIFNDFLNRLKSVNEDISQAV